MIIDVLRGFFVSAAIASGAAWFVWHQQRRREITEMLARYEQEMQTVQGKRG